VLTFEVVGAFEVAGAFEPVGTFELVGTFEPAGAFETDCESPEVDPLVETGALEPLVVAGADVALVLVVEPEVPAVEAPVVTAEPPPKMSFMYWLISRATGLPST